jgi:hypothetical protein
MFISQNREFIKRWILLIAVGLLVGYVLSLRLLPTNEVMSFSSKYQSSPFLYNVLVGILAFGGFGIIVGLSVGIAQFIVLRKKFPITPSWIFLTTVGYFSGFSIVGSLTVPSMDYISQFAIKVFDSPIGVGTVAVYIVISTASGILPTIVSLIIVNSIFGIIVGGCLGIAHSMLLPRGRWILKYILGFVVSAISTSFTLTLLYFVVHFVSKNIVPPLAIVYIFAGLMAGVIAWSIIGKDLLMGLNEKQNGMSA